MTRAQCCEGMRARVLLHLYSLLIILMLVAAAAFGSTSTVPVHAQTSSFSPFTGTADVTYTSLPWYYLPAMATTYAGNHRLLVHFAVRDRTHFRVDIQTISPAIDSGTLTVAIRGRSILSYDTRTETAGEGQMPVNMSPLEKKYIRNYLLGFLMAGQAPIGGVDVLNPTQSVDGFVANLGKQLVRRYPPEYPKSYARIVGQESVAGRPADVVQYGPLYISDRMTGSSFSHPGHCVHHYRSVGTGKLWIDQVHPFILREVQQGAKNVHSLDVPTINSDYRVTNIAYGIGPSRADLHFRPPVPVIKTKNWTLLSSGASVGSGGALSLPKGFMYLPQPHGTKKLSVNEGMMQITSGPLQKLSSLDILYSSGRHVTTYLHPGDRYGVGIYIKGPYMYIQEQVQVHGLPAGLQTGTLHTAGSCQAWTGTYPHHQRWIALAKGRVSFLIVSNVISENRLVTYAARNVCS